VIRLEEDIAIGIESTVPSRLELQPVNLAVEEELWEHFKVIIS